MVFQHSEVFNLDSYSITCFESKGWLAGKCHSRANEVSVHYNHNSQLTRKRESQIEKYIQRQNLPCRCAGENDIAGFQRKALRQLCDDFINLE